MEHASRHACPSCRHHHADSAPGEDAGALAEDIAQLIVEVGVLVIFFLVAFTPILSAA